MLLALTGDFSPSEFIRILYVPIPMKIGVAMDYFSQWVLGGNDICHFWARVFNRKYETLQHSLPLLSWAVMWWMESNQDVPDWVWHTHTVSLWKSALDKEKEQDKNLYLIAFFFLLVCFNQVLMFLFFRLFWHILDHLWFHCNTTFPQYLHMLRFKTYFELNFISLILSLLIY